MAQDDINGSYLKQRNNAYLTPSQRMKQQFQAEAIVEDTDRPFSIMPVIDFAGDVIGDVAGGIVEIPKQTAGGVLDATKELAQFLESAIPLGTLGGDDLTEDSFIELGEARTVTGGLVRGVSQFLTGFLPAMKGAKAAGLATKGAKGVGTAMGAGAVADAIVFDPHEDRLSNLVEQFPELQNPVTGYLAADPDDSEAEGRFKNAIEGLALGALAEGFFSAAKGIKAARVNRIEEDKLASEMAQIDSLASIDVPEGNGVNVGEVNVEQVDIPKFNTDAEKISAINKIETGEPVKAYYLRNEQSGKDAAPAGMDFGQDIEPSGEYMNFDFSDTMASSPPDGWSSGVIEFQNPLILEHKSTSSTGWKKDLSDMFDGKTGKELTQAIKDAGYDGVITKDADGFNETVNIAGKKIGLDEQVKAVGGGQAAQVKPDEFLKAFEEGTKGNKNKLAVAMPDVDDFDEFGVRAFTLDDGNLGYAIEDDGTLTTVFKNPNSTVNGALKLIVDDAIANGATKLQAFDGYLVDQYKKLGFEEVRRDKWNPEFAPIGWDEATMGTPDVVDMKLKEELINDRATNARRTASSEIRQDQGLQEGNGGIRGQEREVYSGDEALQEGAAARQKPRDENGSLADLPNPSAEYPAANNPKISAVARGYAEANGIEYNPPTQYVKVDKERAASIAEEFDKMPHAPNDPEVKAAYEKMAEETIAQYQAVIDSGLKVEFIDFAKQGDPYPNPRAAIEDIKNNNHLWVFKTRDGFGSDDVFDASQNPLLAETDFEISGEKALVNDLFRAVHDYFGHAKEGVGFRADGEDNAWRAHRSMYSPLAARAMTTETRGQNSWVNFGPNGEKNRTAKSEDTVFADQKTGLLPEWVSQDGQPPKDIPVKADVVDDFIPFQDKLGGADEPTFKVGRKKAGAERAANINLRNINTTKDVEDAIEGTAAKYSKDINEARREIITQEETIKLADDLGLTVDELLSRRKGQAFNAEQAVAARNLLVASGEKLVALAKVAKTGGDVDVAAFRRALAQHNAIQSQVSGLTAEAGRALQSFNIIAKSSKQQERMIRESLDIGGGIDVSREMAEKISMLDSPMKVNIATRDLQKATKGEMFYELWINGLLSSPATHAVNILSNSLVAGWSVGERKIASMIGGVLDVQSIPNGEASAQAYGMIYGAKDGFRLAWEALKTGEPSDLLNKIETAQFRAISAENLELSGTAGRAADFLGNVARLSGRFLTSEDEFFKSVGYRMELHAQAYRSAHEEGLEGDALARRMIEIINDPPENIELEAINAMRYQTFTRELGETGKTLQNGIGAINRFTIENVGVPSARVILPFIQTPTNIVKYVAERTPLAALSKDFRADIKAGGARRDMALAKVATGSMAMAIGVEMSLSGQITGGGSLNYEMKNMQRATGWQPYSIKVGDKYISYGRLDPIGAFIGLAADAAEVVGQADDADAFDVAYAASIAVGKNLTSKTYLSGLAEFFDVMSSTSADPESDETKARRFIERMGGSIVPAGVAQVERVIDPTMSATQGIIEKVKSRIPSLSSDLPPRRNIFGEPIVLEGGIGPDIMSPFYASTDKKDSIADEIVSQRTVVSMPNRSIRGVKLDTRQYDKYVRLYAGESNPYIKKPLRVALKDLFNSSQYREGTDGQEGSKSAMIRGVFNGYKQAAQQAIIEQDTSLVISIQQEIQEKKINLGVQ